ncbi:hypothetical protein B7463_g3977, partial [Scytalidium lignicola]
MTVMYSIPVIDISPFLNPKSTLTQQKEVVSAVRDACVSYGFFQLVGHGVPLKLQQQIIGCAKTFFELPLAEKQELAMSKAMGESNRGYERVGGQALESDKLPDLKEGIYIGREISPDNPRAGAFLHGPNMWPKLPHETFRTPIEEYRTRMVEVAHHLLKILALGLPYADDIFEEFMLEPVANVRLLHYPPQTSKDERQLGAGAHTDFGCITLLLQQPDTTGLEVLYPPTNSWIPVPAVADRFIVNIGDLLDKWTGGHYRSALHRVINFGETDRYSVPFFYSGNLATRLMPLDGSEGEGITVEEHIKGKFKKSYSMKK